MDCAIVVSSGASKVVDTDADLDTKFEQLSQYIQLWATKSYGESEGSKKSSSGLTTPVIVRPSSRSSVGTPNSLELDGVLSRNGVRILFQTTNTGDMMPRDCLIIINLTIAIIHNTTVIVKWAFLHNLPWGNSI